MTFFRSLNYDDNEYYGETDWRKRPHGFGIIRFKNGDEFRGNFVHGLAHGSGTTEYKNGDEVSCDYVNGVPHGTAFYHAANGEEYLLKVSNGKIISEEKL